jgi:PAS domain-containing protein
VSPNSPKAGVSDLEHLQLAIAAAGVTLWSWNVDSDELTMDDLAFDLWGVPRSARVTFEDLSAHIHPADRERVRLAFSATRGIVGPYEIDFRIFVENEIRWVSARGHEPQGQKPVGYCVGSDGHYLALDDLDG